MSIRDFYYNLEEKWYKTLDKVDEKIPVYSIIDKVDSVIPSFLLFLIIVAFILLVIVGGIWYSILTYDANFNIRSASGEVVYDTLIEIKLINNGAVVNTLKSRTDDFGNVKFSGLSKNQEILLDINISKGTYTNTFYITEDFSENIVLREKIDLKEIKRLVILKSPFGNTITTPLQVEFYCENRSVVPTPNIGTTSQGQIEVIEPLNCVRLYAKVLSEEYKQDPFLVNSNPFMINLQVYEPPLTTFTVKIRQNGLPISGSNFRITLDGKNTYTKTSTSSDVIFDIVPGNYFMSINDLDSDFATVSRNIVVPSTNGSETVEVSKTVKAVITVNVIDQLNKLKIEEAIVNLRKDGKEIDSRKTDVNGNVIFAVTDISDYTVIAKKPGDTNGGYFAKEMPLQNVNSNINITLELERITLANAGRTKVIVVDQDNIPVANARVVLKYEKDDTLVELNSNKNYVFTNENGEAELLAGNIKERVYAYAAKNPFEGNSTVKLMSVENLNEFTITMQVGNTQVRLNVIDELGEKVTGEAQIYDIQNNEISGILSIENGVVQTSIKAGRIAYVKVNAEGFIQYFSAPLFLWPNKTENFNITLKKEVSEPAVILEGIYNKSNQAVRTMKAGEKYYALLTIESDTSYTDTILHFRTGKEQLMENDILYIENVEAVNVYSQVMGKSYTNNYEMDSGNLTESLAKWVNIGWKNFNGIMQAKVHFKIKENAAPNKEIQFFYRAEFDNINKPVSEAEVDLYKDTYNSNIYFVGEEAICEDDFCIMSEWLFDNVEELYVFSPYTVKQVNEYKYNFQIVNNSNTDYGSASGKKPIYLNLKLIGDDGKGIKIKEYKIREASNELSGENLKTLENLEIKNFEKNTTINIELIIEGVAQGNSIIKTELKADGLIIFANERNFNTPSQKQLIVSLNRTFIPALLNTEILVEVRDDKGEVLNNTDVIIYGKEVGFEESVIDQGVTNRFGKVTLNSGAHFTTTKIIIDVSKNGFARERIALLVREEILQFNPPALAIELDVVTNKEKTESVQVGNVIGKNLEILELKYLADFGGIINEGALIAYLNGLTGTILERESVSDIDIIRIRLDNGVNLDTFIEPLNTNGSLVMTVRVSGTNVIYDTVLPFNLRVVSEARTTSTECLLVNNAKQTKTTESGRVIYTFEMINACVADNIPLKVENIRVSATGDIPGNAELSLQSTTSTKGGRTALDGAERKIIEFIDGGEKLIGTLMYTPSMEAAGKTIPIAISITGKFMNNTVTTKPSKLEFNTNVINLKECMSISGDSGIVAFDGETTITVDATACLGQKIDVYLCYNDAGCSGGTEGSISLSRRNFTLQNTSETVNVYSPSLPGSYGVGVWARVSGSTSSFSYIGEVPVAFREPETRWFELSKYEVNIMGSGTEDVILLTNKMLTQDVVVEADNCTWGVKEPDTDWMQVLGGAMIGATLGNMIGGAFESGTKDVDTTKGEGKDAPATSEGGASGQQGTTTGTQQPTIEQQINSAFSDESGWNSGANHVYRDGTILNDGSDNLDNLIRYKDVTINGDTVTLVQRTYTPVGMDVPYTENGIVYRGIYNTSPDNIQVVSNSIQQNTTGFRGLTNRFWGNSGDQTGSTILREAPSSSTPQAPPIGSPSPTSPLYNPQPIAPDIISPIDQFTGTATVKKLEIKENKISFGGISFPGEEVITSVVIDVGEKISFRAAAGWGTIIGAVAGGLAAYYMQDYDCKDHTQMATYTDYAIFLQGETINVMSADKKTNEERVVPSNAGALGFTLGGVSPSWDFTNADYSSVETVGIKFTNSGLNNPLPKYGTLTINATTNMHGKQLSLDDRYISTTDRSDVFCKNPNFGEFWIGDTNESGECSPVTQGNYSQKYHIRVTSAEPKGAEAYLKKANTCYNGVLTGSTGAEAVPKVLLNWDWSSINKDTCAYANPNYVYCDATQFTISLVKRLAELDEFFNLNQTFTCPEDPILSGALESMQELNNVTEIVADGYIGVREVNVSVVNDKAVATVKVDNRTGSSIQTAVSYSWKGEGAPINDQYNDTFASGQSEILLEADIPKYDGVYFFTIVFNGPSGNRRVITHAFRNAPLDSECWANNSTRAQGGVPAVTYYLADQGLQPVGNIQNGSDLYSRINFGAYLMRDAYSQQFFKDFSEFYLTSAFQGVSEPERRVLEYIKNGKLNITKRFTTQERVEAGLYDVWLNIDFAEDNFLIVDNDTKTEASLLLVRNPVEPSPFYNIPFNGMIGQNNRQGYGATYDNENEEIIINDNSNLLVTPRTFQDATGNGIVRVSTSIERSFEKLNSSVASRGTLANVSFNGNNASIVMSPNYATPVIVRYSSETGQNEMKYNVERNGTPVLTGGNLLFWTGAAKSKNFYGGNAVETYNDSPDYLLDSGDEYGFVWQDVTHPGTMYLKTIIYTPTNARFMLVAKDSKTSFSTTNSGFAPRAELVGINQMNYNSEFGGSSLTSIEDLFDMVRNQQACITNDGSIASFWWNPRVIATTSGSINSLENIEVSLIEQN